MFRIEKTAKGMHRGDVRNLLIICSSVILLTLPFINKAVHIDGVYVVAAAENILKNPFDPYGFNFNFAAGKIPFHSYYSNSPLLSYYLAAVFFLFGKSIMMAHVSFIIFPLIAAISFYFIAKRFVRFPLAAVLLFIGAPVFLAMSHNLMQDVPMASFFLLSLALFMRGIERDKWSFLVGGSFAAGLAILMKYTAFLIIPLLILYAFQKKELKKAGYLLIAIGVVMVWMVSSFSLYHSVHTIQSFSNYDGGMLGNIKELGVALAVRGVSELTLMGGILMFPLCLIFPFLRGKRRWFMFFISFLLALGMASVLHLLSAGFVSGQYGSGELVQFTVFVTSSVFFMMAALDYVWIEFLVKRNMVTFLSTDIAFIFSWFLLIFFSIVLLVGGAARYNTLILGPFILLFMRMVFSFQLKSAVSMLKICVALTMVLGIMVSIADYRYAEVYRSGAKKFSSLETGTNTVWFSGHHGFAHYMVLEGGEFYSKESPLKIGDFVVKASIPSPREISKDDLEKMKLVSNKIILDGFPFRTENPFSHAGFYTFGSGFLPYSVSTSPLEEFFVYEVGDASK